MDFALIMGLWFWYIHGNPFRNLCWINAGGGGWGNTGAQHRAAPKCSSRMAREFCNLRCTIHSLQYFGYLSQLIQSYPGHLASPSHTPEHRTDRFFTGNTCSILLLLLMAALEEKSSLCTQSRLWPSLRCCEGSRVWNWSCLLWFCKIKMRWAASVPSQLLSDQSWAALFQQLSGTGCWNRLTLLSWEMPSPCKAAALD